MSERKKKKRGSSDFDQISIGEEEGLSLSIGGITGNQPLQAAQEGASPGGVPAKARKKTEPADIGIEAFLQSALKAALHRETAGRGGRTVTLVDLRPEPDARTAAAIAKAMRKGLGCGAHVEGASVVLHGDIKERAAAWLSKGGVRKVVR